MRLNARKQKLKSLMMKVQQYQFERTRGSTFTRTERILEAEDIDRLVEGDVDLTFLKRFSRGKINCMGV